MEKITALLTSFNNQWQEAKLSLG